MRLTIFTYTALWLIIIFALTAYLSREPKKEMDGAIEILHSGVE